jgi:hypothetical protein
MTSGFFSLTVLRIRIRDPVLFCPTDPGWSNGRIRDKTSRIRDKTSRIRHTASLNEYSMMNIKILTIIVLKCTKNCHIDIFRHLLIYSGRKPVFQFFQKGILSNASTIIYSLHYCFFMFFFLNFVCGQLFSYCQNWRRLLLP